MFEYSWRTCWPLTHRIYRPPRGASFWWRNRLGQLFPVSSSVELFGDGGCNMLSSCSPSNLLSGMHTYIYIYIYISKYLYLYIQYIYIYAYTHKHVYNIYIYISPKPSKLREHIVPPVPLFVGCFGPRRCRSRARPPLSAERDNENGITW